jgi:CRP/FNR family transcriptional regulator
MNLLAVKPEVYNEAKECISSRSIFMERPWYLNEVDIIAELSEDEKSFLLHKSFKKKYSKGAIIHSPGDKGRDVNYVMSGRVKIYNLAACGKEIIYRFCNPHSFFGIAEIFGGENREVFAEAVEDTEILCITKDSFEALIRNNPRLALSVMKILSSRIRQAHKAIQDFVVCDARSRLAQLLIKLSQINGMSDRGGITIRNKFTHQEMANMIGTRRQTVTEIINDFKRRGFIKCDGGRIVLLDQERLKNLIEG